MSEDPFGRRLQSVLFACTFNAVRSPMAEALARHHFGRDVFFCSTGVRPGQLDPFAVAVMEEIGIDISRHKPRVFADLEDEAFDAIVSLSPEAHHSALEYTRSMAVHVVYWPTLDPTAVQGSREQILNAYRDVRDGLAKRIHAMLGQVIGGRRII